MNTNDALEAAIQQMRASGVDEATIEIYRQQMAMAQQMASNPMLTINFDCRFVHAIAIC